MKKFIKNSIKFIPFILILAFVYILCGKFIPTEVFAKTVEEYVQDVHDSIGRADYRYNDNNKWITYGKWIGITEVVMVGILKV